MSSKRTYINLLNDFWEADSREAFSAPVTRLYFYLLNRINRNRWEPVFISDAELSEATGASRFRLPGYRDELQTRGFIDFKKTGTGRQAGTYYCLPIGTDPNGTVNRPIGDSLEKTNCPKRDRKIKRTDPNGTVNRPIGDSLELSTPYNISIKTYIRHNAAAAGAGARTREEEIFENLKAQVEEMKNSQIWMEQTQKHFRLSRAEIVERLDEFLTEMTSQGEVVQKPKMLFSYWLERKRRQPPPQKTREEHRQELFNAAYQALQEGLADPFGLNKPKTPDPF